MKIEPASRRVQSILPPSIPYKWIVLGVLTLSHLMTSFAALSVQPLAPFLQKDLALRHVDIGIFTSVFYLGAFFLSFPIGWVVDRFGASWVLAATQILVGGFILGLSSVHTFATGCLFLLLAGIGYAGITPATGKAVMCWFSWNDRGTAMSIKQTGIPLGGAAAAAMVPALAYGFSWRIALVASGTAAIASGLLSLLLYREPVAEERRMETASFAYTRWAGMLDILRNRDIMLLSILMIPFMALQMVLVTYLLLFLKDALARSILVAGAYLSLAHIGGVAGRLTWGGVSDYLCCGRRKAVLIAIGGISAAMCLACSYLSPGLPSWLLLVVVFAFGFSAIGWNGIYLTLVAELAGADRAGTATGASLSIIYLGVLFGPPLFGFLVDRTGSYSSSWLIASCIVAAASLLISLVREKERESSYSRPGSGGNGHAPPGGATGGTKNHGKTEGHVQ